MKEGTTNESIRRPMSFSDYEKDRLLILSTSQNIVASVFMVLGNISIAIALLYALIKYNDLFIVSILAVAGCFVGLVEKMLLGSIQRHDQAIILEYELNKEYIQNHENYILDKETIIRERKAKLSNVRLSSGKSVLKFKEEIHKAAFKD